MKQEFNMSIEDSTPQPEDAQLGDFSPPDNGAASSELPSEGVDSDLANQKDELNRKITSPETSFEELIAIKEGVEAVESSPEEPDHSLPIPKNGSASSARLDNYRVSANKLKQDNDLLFADSLKMAHGDELKALQIYNVRHRLIVAMALLHKNQSDVERLREAVNFYTDLASTRIKEILGPEQ